MLQLRLDINPNGIPKMRRTRVAYAVAVKDVGERHILMLIVRPIYIDAKRNVADLISKEKSNYCNDKLLTVILKTCTSN